MVHVGLLFKDDFYHTVDEVFEYLTSQRNYINGESGWHHFLESGKIGNIATAQILILHKRYGRPIPALDSCLAWFKANRREVTWHGNTIAGWSYLSSGPAVPCIEPTCWVYLAHVALRTEIDAVELDTQTFLKRTSIVSEHGISWGLTPWTESRILPTCMGIRVLSAMRNQKGLDESVRWLLAARNSEGAWGPVAKSASTLTHTALAIDALMGAGYNSTNPIIRSGCDFLLRGLREWASDRRSGRWTERNIGALMEIVDIPPFPPIESRPTRIQYYFNPLLRLVPALFVNSDQSLPYLETLAIEATRSWARTRWKHPFLKDEQRVTSWSIFDHLLVLELFQRRWFEATAYVIFYILSSRGAWSLPIVRGETLLRVLRSARFLFFLRLIVFIVIVLLITSYVLQKTGLVTTVIEVGLAVLFNALYEYVKHLVR